MLYSILGGVAIGLAFQKIFATKSPNYQNLNIPTDFNHNFVSGEETNNKVGNAIVRPSTNWLFDLSDIE